MNDTLKERTAIVFGQHGMIHLDSARIAVYGLGGVGAAAAVDLVRTGTGTVSVADFDTVSTGNLNRLVFGFTDTVGERKVDVFSATARKINRDVQIVASDTFVSGSDAETHVDMSADIHIDAIDSLNPKVNLIIALRKLNKPFISVMGTAGKVRPELLTVTAMSETETCSLARMVRKRLRRRGVPLDFPAVWSDESPVPPVENPADPPAHGRIRKIQGSTVFVPQTAGHIAASWCVRQLLGAGKT